MLLCLWRRGSGGGGGTIPFLLYFQETPESCHSYLSDIVRCWAFFLSFSLPLSLSLPFYCLFSSDFFNGNIPPFLHFYLYLSVSLPLSLSLSLFLHLSIYLSLFLSENSICPYLTDAILFTSDQYLRLFKTKIDETKTRLNDRVWVIDIKSYATYPIF